MHLPWVPRTCRPFYAIAEMRGYPSREKVAIEAERVRISGQFQHPDTVRPTSSTSIFSTCKSLGINALGPVKNSSGIGVSA